MVLTIFQIQYKIRMSLSNISSQNITPPSSPVNSPKRSYEDKLSDLLQHINYTPRPEIWNEDDYDNQSSLNSPSYSSEIMDKDINEVSTPSTKSDISLFKFRIRRPEFMEPLSIGSSAVSSPIDWTTNSVEYYEPSHVSSLLNEIEVQMPKIIPPPTPIPDDLN